MEMVKRRRVKRNGSRPWSPEEDALLGTMPDDEVARRTRRNRTAVFLRRQNLGIPSWRASSWKARWHWTPEQDALLGTMPDAALAEKLGVPKKHVFFRRQRLGITAFQPHRPAE